MSSSFGPAGDPCNKSSNTPRPCLVFILVCIVAWVLVVVLHSNHLTPGNDHHKIIDGITPNIVSNVASKLVEHKTDDDINDDIPQRASTGTCVPENLHISPAMYQQQHQRHDESKDGTTSTTTTTESETVGFYVSFTLDYKRCAKSIPIIRYGWSSNQNNDNSNNNNNNNSNNSNNEKDDDGMKNAPKMTERICPPKAHPDDMERIQFDRYNTPLSKQSSPWIYHGIIKGIPIGSHNPWYQIDVYHTIDNDDNDNESSDDDQEGLTDPYTTTTTTSFSLLSLLSTAKTTTTTTTVPTTRWTSSTTQKIYYNLPPSIGTPTTLAFVADWGSNPTAIRVMERIRNETVPTVEDEKISSFVPLMKIDNTNTHDVSAVIVVGDISYANGDLSWWESWMTSMQPLFQSTNLLVVPGNHELECDERSYEVFQAYEHYFRTPYYSHRQPVIRKSIPFGPTRVDCVHHLDHPTHVAFAEYHGGNSYYSYQHGMAHIVVLNSYVDSSVGSIQYKWFQHDVVTNFNRSLTPWLIVVFHCPLRTTFHGHNHEGHPQVMMNALEPLFLKFGVNLIFSGHNHAYVRTHSLKGHNEEETVVDVTGKSPVYFTVGTGGDSHSDGPIHDRPEDWVASRDHTVFGAGKLFIQNATYAKWERLLLPDDEKQMDQKQLEETRDATIIINHNVLSMKQN